MNQSYDFWCRTVDVIDDVERSLSAPDFGQGGSIQALRGALVARFEAHRRQLLTVHGATLTEALMFPLVVAIDEKIQMHLGGNAGRFRLLQAEILGIDTGGESFFRRLRSHLDDPTMPRLVFELYAYLIKSGFRGIYAAQPDALERPLAWIDARLATQPGPELAFEGKSVMPPEPELGGARRPRTWMRNTLIAALLLLSCGYGVAVNLLP